MVNNTNEHTRKAPAKQGELALLRKPMKIGAATPYDFKGSNLTPYGGLLPVATMLEKLGFQQLIERHVTIKRLTTSMPGFRFVMAMILDEMRRSIPKQATLWVTRRFNSVH